MKKLGGVNLRVLSGYGFRPAPRLFSPAPHLGMVAESKAVKASRVPVPK